MAGSALRLARGRGKPHVYLARNGFTGQVVAIMVDGPFFSMQVEIPRFDLATGLRALARRAEYGRR